MDNSLKNTMSARMGNVVYLHADGFGVDSLQNTEAAAICNVEVALWKYCPAKGGGGNCQSIESSLSRHRRRVDDFSIFDC